MKIATFDGDRIGLVVDDRVLDVTDSVTKGRRTGLSAMRTLIENWPDVKTSLEPSDSFPLDSVALQAPVPDPTKIFAAPVNYRDHQTEMRVESHISALGLFLKANSSVIGPGGTVLLPYHDRRFDQEGELAVVVGRKAHRVSREDALDHVFGYTGLLDITMRGGEDRSTRKSFETFTPMGPWIVTRDEWPTDDTGLRCWVNNDLRQDAHTRDLIWDVASLVSYASWITTLYPGDVISTGTPAGVGQIFHGDSVELEISALGGRLKVSVSADGAIESHTTGRDSAQLPVSKNQEMGSMEGRAS